jgi:hypothetical protein
MGNTIKTNCYEETGYYIDNGRVTTKPIVRVEPAQDREKIACQPVVLGIAEKNNLSLDLSEIEWDEVGRDKPDGIVHIKNGSNIWIEHTRISDHYQHFVNEKLKVLSDQTLDQLNAPKSLFVRYPDNTQVNAARAFCRTWETWEVVRDVQEAIGKVRDEDRGGSKGIHGYKIMDSESSPLRIYFLEASKRPLSELFEDQIKSKEKKYGMLAHNTVLVIDDETRAYYSGEIMEAAHRYGDTCKSTFRGIYVVSFTGLRDGTQPNWVLGTIKEYSV